MFFYLAPRRLPGPECLALKVSGVLMCLMSAAGTAAATALHQTDSPQLPGVTSHGTRDDWARASRPLLSHRVALVTPYSVVALLGKTCYAPAPRKRQASKIETFCKSFCSCQNSTRRSIRVNTQWRAMYFITYISQGNAGLYLPSPSTTAAPTQPNYLLAEQHKRSEWHTKKKKKKPHTHTVEIGIDLIIVWLRPRLN